MMAFIVVLYLVILLLRTEGMEACYNTENNDFSDYFNI